MTWQALDLDLTASSGVHSELLMALCEIVGQLSKIAEAHITVKVAELLLPLQLFSFLDCQVFSLAV